MCPYNIKSCKCGDRTQSAAFDGCEGGYCIGCFECERAGEAVHNVYVCTGYEKRTEAME